MKTLKIKSLNEILPKVKDFRIKVLLEFSEKTLEIDKKLRDVMKDSASFSEEKMKQAIDEVTSLQELYTESLEEDRQELPLSINFLPSLSKKEEKCRLELVDQLEGLEKESNYESLMLIARYLSKITERVLMDDGSPFNKFIDYDGEINREVLFDKFYSTPMLRDSIQELFSELTDLKKILAPVSK